MVVSALVSTTAHTPASATAVAAIAPARKAATLVVEVISAVVKAATAPSVAVVVVAAVVGASAATASL